MRTYRVADMTIASSLPLPELPEVGAEAPDTTFSVASAPMPPEGALSWTRLGRRSLDGALWVARTDDGFHLRFDQVGHFFTTRDGRVIRCWPEERVPRITIRHVLLDQVVPRVRAMLGDLVLHASAVAMPQGAVAFLGRSGAGKSTLAAHCWKAGYSVLADDCLIVLDPTGAPHIRPLYRGLRLHRTQARRFGVGNAAPEVAHYTDKVRVDTNDDAHAAMCPPLVRLYLLATSGDARVRIAHAPPVQGFMTLVRQRFRLDIANKERLRDEAAMFSEGPLRSRLRVLCYRHDMEGLPAVMEAIQQDLDAPS